MVNHIDPNTGVDSCSDLCYNVSCIAELLKGWFIGPTTAAFYVVKILHSHYE